MIWCVPGLLRSIHCTTSHWNLDSILYMRGRTWSGRGSSEETSDPSVSRTDLAALHHNAASAKDFQQGYDGIICMTECGYEFPNDRCKNDNNNNNKSCLSVMTAVPVGETQESTISYKKLIVKFKMMSLMNMTDDAVFYCIISTNDINCDSLRLCVQPSKNCWINRNPNRVK